MRLDRETLRDPQVGGEVARYVAVRYDGDAPTGDALARQYGVRGYPTFVVLDGDGRKLDEFAGFRSPTELVQRMRMRAP